MKYYLIAIIFLKATAAYTQNADNGLSKKQGIIVFEDKVDMYFIETPITNLKALMKSNKDTIEAFILHTTDGVNNFKDYLNQKVIFDSSSFLITQDYKIGNYVSTTTKVFWKHGHIEFSEGLKYKLEKRYKTLNLRGNVLVIALEDYISIETFIAADQRIPRKKKKLKKCKCFS